MTKGRIHKSDGKKIMHKGGKEIKVGVCAMSGIRFCADDRGVNLPAPTDGAAPVSGSPTTSRCSRRCSPRHCHTIALRLTACPAPLSSCDRRGSHLT